MVRSLQRNIYPLIYTIYDVHTPHKEPMLCVINNNILGFQLSDLSVQYQNLENHF